MTMAVLSAAEPGSGAASLGSSAAGCHEAVERSCELEPYRDLEQSRERGLRREPDRGRYERCRDRDLLREGDLRRERECWQDLDWCQECNWRRDSERCLPPAVCIQRRIIAGFPRDCAACGSIRGLMQRARDLRAVIAVRSLVASKVSGLKGSYTSSITGPGESNCTGLNGPPCGAKVNGAGSKSFGAGGSSLGHAPLNGSDGGS